MPENNPEERAPKGHGGWCYFLRPLKLTVLVVNALCFGVCIVLLGFTAVTAALILLTIGTGLSVFAGLVGAIIASRKHFRLAR